MNRLQDIFTSPEYYPLFLNIEKGTLSFLRMSRESYRDSVFLDLRTQHVGEGKYEVRLDDVLLAASMAPRREKPTHYILNSAYCCSTLLARYFELIPSCFVLKEPRLLAQMAVMAEHDSPEWQSMFDCSVRLLSRTYEPDQVVVMKPVDCCSPIGRELLEQNSQATITFLMIPLRKFLLSILKSGERREWARVRVRTVFKNAIAALPALAGVEPENLSVAESAACLWLVHRLIGEELCSGRHRSRVVMVNGDQLADSPESVLPRILELCGMNPDGETLKNLLEHPSISRYSKDLSRPYDASSRMKEWLELEQCWGAESQSGEEWAMRHGYRNTGLETLELAMQ